MNKRFVLVGSVTALTLATAGAFLLWTPSPGEHRIMVENVEPAKTPETVQEVAWTWKPAEGTNAQSVFIGLAGPIVMLDDGISALDGDNGEEIWSYKINDLHEPAAQYETIKIGVTSDRKYTVLSWKPQKMVEYVNVAVLNSGSGELIDEYRLPSSEEMIGDYSQPPLPPLERLSMDTWLDAEGDGFSARSIFDGEKKWDYTPDSECRILYNYSHENFEDFSVLIGEDTLVFGQYCEEDVSEGTFYGDLIALDAENGSEKWTIENRISLARSEIDMEYDVRKTDMNPMWDPGYITVATEQGTSLVDIDTGNIILDDTRDLFPDSPDDSAILDANEDRVIDVNRHIYDQPSIFTTTDTHSGEIESMATLPSTDFNHYLLLPEDLNISFSWPNIIPLSGGVLTTTCKNECENNTNTDYTDTVTFIPSAPEEEEVTVELPLPSDASQKSTHTLLASPGSVIAYTKIEGAIPEIFGLK